jgi:hypothetical protein
LIFSFERRGAPVASVRCAGESAGDDVMEVTGRPAGDDGARPFEGGFSGQQSGRHSIDHEDRSIHGRTPSARIG